MIQMEGRKNNFRLQNITEKVTLVSKVMKQNGENNERQKTTQTNKKTL